MTNSNLLRLREFSDSWKEARAHIPTHSPNSRKKSMMLELKPTKTADIWKPSLTSSPNSMMKIS